MNDVVNHTTGWLKVLSLEISSKSHIISNQRRLSAPRVELR
jgi:hypothetical protein